jgi:hypothetical protein
MCWTRLLVFITLVKDRYLKTSLFGRMTWMFGIFLLQSGLDIACTFCIFMLTTPLITIEQLMWGKSCRNFLTFLFSSIKLKQIRLAISWLWLLVMVDMLVYSGSTGLFCQGRFRFIAEYLILLQVL